MLKETLRSTWFSAGLHAGLWLLLLLAIIGIGGRAPEFHEAADNPATVHTPIPVLRLKNLFAATNWPPQVVEAATLNPFATTHFMPSSPPPPPPPTTQKVQLTYQGFYRSGDGPIHTLLRLGETLVAIRVGGMVVTNLYVMNADMQTLTLTNNAAQTNVLTVNIKKEIEVPLK